MVLFIGVLMLLERHLQQAGVMIGLHKEIIEMGLNAINGNHKTVVQ
jgi:hypothetical protein